MLASNVLSCKVLTASLSATVTLSVLIDLIAYEVNAAGWGIPFATCQHTHCLNTCHPASSLNAPVMVRGSGTASVS